MQNESHEPAINQPDNKNIIVHPEGAFMSIDHRGRVVPGYVIAETEFDGIAGTGLLLDALFGVAALFIGLPIGFIWDAAMTPSPRPDGMVATTILLTVICAIVSGLSIGGIVWQWKNRQKIIEKIRTPSGD